MSNPASLWQPRAHYAANTPKTHSGLLDSGASHHVTSDLSNLSMHAPYNGSNDIIIGKWLGPPHHSHWLLLSHNFSTHF